MKSEKQLKRAKTKIRKETIEKMEILGVYRKEFITSIERYSEMRIQYDVLNESWYEDDCRITENYTNKSGATNQRKTALYLSLENLRKELIDMENLFGLTPKGLKAIKTKGLENKKKSKLEEALGSIE